MSDDFAIASTNPEDSYLGIPNEYVLNIGKMTIAAGNLEGFGHGVIQGLGDTSSGSELAFNTLMRKIQRRLSLVGVPYCALGDHNQLTTDVHAWCDEAIIAMNRRHSIIHAQYFFTFRSSDCNWISTRNHIRPKDRIQLSMGDLDSIRESIEDAVNKGRRFHDQLLHHLADGTRFNHYVDVHGQADGEGQKLFAAAREIYPACAASLLGLV